METIQSLKISAFQLKENKSKFITVTFLRDSLSFFRFTSLRLVNQFLHRGARVDFLTEPRRSFYLFKAFYLMF